MHTCGSNVRRIEVLAVSSDHRVGEHPAQRSWLPPRTYKHKHDGIWTSCLFLVANSCRDCQFHHQPVLAKAKLKKKRNQKQSTTLAFLNFATHEELFFITTPSKVHLQIHAPPNKTNFFSSLPLKKKNKKREAVLEQTTVQAPSDL